MPDVKLPFFTLALVFGFLAYVTPTNVMAQESGESTRDETAGESAEGGVNETDGSEQPQEAGEENQAFSTTEAEDPTRPDEASPADPLPAPVPALPPPPTQSPLFVSAAAMEGLPAERGFLYISDPFERVDAWIEYQRNRDQSGRYLGAGLIIGLGVLYMGGGVALAFSDEEELKVLSSVTVGLGALSVGVGVGVLLVPGPTERRYDRWRALVESGQMTPGMVSSFAGEMLADAEVARFGRMVGIVLGVATAIGGTAALTMTLLATEDEVSRVLGASLGGTMAVTGLALALLSLIPSRIEQDYERFRRGLAPEDRDPGLFGFTPTFSPDGGGLVLQGQF